MLLGKGPSPHVECGIRHLRYVYPTATENISTTQHLYSYHVSSSVIGLTLGPLLGGIITQYVSWRWCFGINVPIGVFIATFIVLFLRIDDTTDARSKQRLMEKLAQLDLTGTALFSVTLIGLLFGCRLVQSRVPSWTAVGAIFASAAVVAIALAVQQYFTRTEGLLPVPIFRANAVWACCGLMLCLSAGLASHVSFLPLFFQVRGRIAGLLHENHSSLTL